MNCKDCTHRHLRAIQRKKNLFKHFSNTHCTWANSQKVRKPVIHFMVPDRGASMGEKKLNYNTLTQERTFSRRARHLGIVQSVLSAYSCRGISSRMCEVGKRRGGASWGCTIPSEKHFLYTVKYSFFAVLY
jgi:hypothetical protein